MPLAPAVPASQRPAPSPLPPLSTPLRASQPELVRRADAGDGAAGCRLAAEWQYCRNVRHQMKVTERMLDPASEPRQWQTMPEGPQRERARAAELASLESMRKGLDALMDEYAHCDGVELGSAAESAARWRQGALNGNPAALREYLVGNAFPNGQSLNLLPALATYRAEAEALAWRAADEGDPMVALVLAAAYDQENPGGVAGYNRLAQIVTADPVTALGLYLRAERTLVEGERDTLWGRNLQQSITRLSKELSPQQLATAKAAAKRGRPLPPGSVTTGFTAFTFGRVESVKREQCEDLDNEAIFVPRVLAPP